MSSTEIVRAIAAYAGIVVPDEDVPILAAAHANEQAGERALAALDVGEVEPIVVFDPRWR
jgi:hypothetical protein